MWLKSSVKKLYNFSTETPYKVNISYFLKKLYTLQFSHSNRKTVSVKVSLSSFVHIFSFWSNQIKNS